MQYAELGKTKKTKADALVLAISELHTELEALYSTDDERPTINSPANGVAIVGPKLEGLEKEELWVIILNNRNHVLDTKMIYRGSVNSAQIRVGELFKDAVAMNGTSIILAHNHPSGDPAPSPDDVAVTRSIVEAGKLLDIELLDHLIIGKGRWVSLKERKLGF